MVNDEATNLIYGFDSDTVVWNYGGMTVTIKLSKPVRTALIWGEASLVVILCGGIEGQYPPSQLLVYKSDGTLKYTLSAPDGYEFYSIIPHPTWGVTVVCGSKDPLATWPEWNFRIDYRRGKLMRYSPNK
jgi:hypothetical protein